MKNKKTVSQLQTTNGFIKIYRSILNWEWYDDVNTSRLFLHLLYTVNWKDGRWRGQVIKRGQRITSLAKLAEETNLSVKKIRIALQHLETTQEVTCQRTRRWTLVTVENYDKYQGYDEQEGTPNGTLSSKAWAKQGQSLGKARATNEEIKEIKDIKEREELLNKEPIAFIDTSGNEVTEAEADAHVERLMRGLKK